MNINWIELEEDCYKTLVVNPYKQNDRLAYYYCVNMNDFMFDIPVLSIVTNVFFKTQKGFIMLDDARPDFIKQFSKWFKDEESLLKAIREFININRRKLNKEFNLEESVLLNSLEIIDDILRNKY